MRAATTAAAVAANHPRRRRPIVRFLAGFVLLMALFYVFTATAWFRAHLFPTYLEWNARAAALVLRGLGESAEAAGTTIISPRFALSVMRGCDGIEPTALLLAAVFAFPAPWRRQAAFAALGAVSLLILNLVRIVSLYYAGVHVPRAFETIHGDIWQPLFIVGVMIMWIAWARRVMKQQAIPVDAAN